MAVFRALACAVFTVLTLLGSATAVAAAAPLRSSALRTQVVAIGTTAPPEEQTARLGEIFRQTREMQRPAGEPTPEALAEEVAALEQFVSENPASPYTPSLRADLAVHYRSEGRFSRALAHWQAAYLATAAFQDGAGKRVCDEVLAHWTRLLAGLGRKEELAVIFAQQRGRVLDRGPLAQMWLRTREAYVTMRDHPEVSYKCGVAALNNVARVLYGTNVPSVAAQPSPARGFTLAELDAFAREERLGLVAVAREEGDALVVPSVVHWQVGHYAAIVRELAPGLYEVADPTFGTKLVMDAAAINDQASGFFLVPASTLPPGWRPATAAEAAEVVGRGYTYSFPDDEDQPCDTCPCPPPDDEDDDDKDGDDADDEEPCCGMPSWRVSEPFINLWLEDTPLAYEPAYGPEVTLQLAYRQRDENAGVLPDFSSFGSLWNCSWFSYVKAQQPIQYNGPGLAEVFLPGGGKVQFTFSSNPLAGPDYNNNGQLLEIFDGDDLLEGFEFLKPDGSKYVYGYRPANTLTTHFFLTGIVDAQGRALTLQYEEVDVGGYWYVRLKRVYDAADTGLASPTQLYYSHSTIPTLVTSVTNRHGDSASFSYTVGGGYEHLTSLTDAVGITSSVSYDANGWPETLTTPYGTTTFTLFAVDEEDPPSVINPRYAKITHPDAALEVYSFCDMLYTGAFGYPGNGSDPAATNAPVVTGAYFEDDAPSYFNSFYWNAKAAASLTTGDPADFVWADHVKARRRHWFSAAYSEPHPAYTPSRTLAFEQERSPDGSTPGQVTWYDYPGRDTNSVLAHGTQNLPSVVARRMPDGTSAFTLYARNSLGHVTSALESWVSGGTTYTRTNTFVYAGNGIDLLERRFGGTSGKLLAAYTYNGQHQVLTMTDALGQVTTNTWLSDGTARLDLVSYPSGHHLKHFYDGTTKYLWRAVDYFGGTSYRTNAYTRLNGRLRTHEDPRGWVTTYTRDGLHRLTRLDYPDSTYELFAYTNAAGTKLLDRTYHRDREGHTTAWVYDSRQRVTNVVDALGHVTLYTYCDCGDQPASVTRAHGTALALTTYFDHDYQGNLLTNTLPEGSTVIHRYDALGRRTTTVDAFTTSTNHFDNLGRLVAVSNAVGRVSFTVYDAEDRPTSVTDHNGVAVSMTYDDVGRLRTRTYPDSGVEAWGYTANVGPATHYTNQLGKVTLYAHDALGRKTNEVQVGMWTNSFTYAFAGELLTLKDGKNQTTTWVYDTEGRVKEKWYQGQSTADLVYGYDADGRLTNRFTRTGGGSLTNGYDTKFTYDASGSLTNVDYPTGTTDLKYAYDALGRLTNMVDAVGTTTYAYTVGGGKEIISEDGPWSGDVLTMTNRQGRRLGLQLTQPTGNAWWQTNAYDAAGRLATLASPAGAFGYGYKGAASGTAASLVGGISLPTTGGTAYVTNFFDTTGRLLSTVLRNSDHSTLNLHEYAYNAAHQRTLGTRTNTSVGATYSRRTGYSYDDGGQLTVAWATNSAGGLESGESRGYAYDFAQNLAKRTNNGAGSTVSATVNALNQLTAGLGFSGSLVYDRRGNLLSIGSAGSGKAFAYDHENQCVTAGYYNAYNKSDFVYDGKGRLRRRLDYQWNGSSWTSTGETRYVYDGMLLVQQRTSSGHPSVTYTRGSDLSGSLEGAGGIGGLLARTAHSGSSPYQPSSHAYYHADGNGNVAYLLNQDRSHGASYKYDPYGRLIASSGGLAAGNLMRFSSKPWHDHSETYYYGYRFYLPEGQRWLNRDPIEEEGGINLYAFVVNGPMNWIDAWGRAGQASSGPPRQNSVRIDFSTQTSLRDGRPQNNKQGIAVVCERSFEKPKLKLKLEARVDFSSNRQEPDARVSTSVSFSWR